MIKPALQNGISSYLPDVLLLFVGVALLLFAIAWTVLQLCSSDLNFFKSLSSRSDNADKETDSGVLAQPELEDERCRRLEEVILMQKQQIASMERQLDDAAKLRHDFRQELLVLQEFARSGDREALERYLPQIKLDSRAVTALPLCPNPLVNTILQFYFNKARAADIKIDAAIQADETLWLSAADVGVLLGNMLENGVTAAAEAPAESRRLRIRTTQTQDCFVIAMGNTFGEPRNTQENGKFASTKPGHTGIGLNSIRAVAQQYDGDAIFRINGDMFMSYAILFRPHISEVGSNGSSPL